jgi:dihydroflavonol-4-reductase
MIIFAQLKKSTALKISISGASGHIGANMIRELLKEGHSLKVLYYHDDRAFAGLNIERVKGDLLDRSTIDELVRDSEIVMHLAAQISISGDKDGHVFRINTEGPRNVCEACLTHGVKRMVHFSSIHAFSAKPFEGILDENRKMVDDSAYRYDFSKATGENIVMDYVKKGLDAVVLNPTSVIGPLDYKPSLMGQVMLRLYNRQLPALVKGGFDFVDVRDVAKAAINAISKGRKGEKYLLSGTWKNISELAVMVEKVTGMKAPAYICPNWLAKLGLPFLNAWAKVSSSQPLYTKESLHVLINAHRNISNQKAKDDLGFNPRPLEDTITDIFTWFKENGYIKQLND